MAVLARTPARPHNLPTAIPGTEVHTTRRRAIATLAVVLALLALAQPLGVVLGDAGLKATYGGADLHSQWQAYISHPAPDVLFLGSSDMRTDVDRALVAAGLTAAAGHPITVGALGAAAEVAEYMYALTYRVMERPSHPRLLVLSTNAPLFKPSYDCDYCRRGVRDQVTQDLWQISDPFDPGFARVALRVSPNPGELVKGYVLPAYAYYPQAMVLAQCSAIDTGRRLTAATGVSEPEVLKADSPCQLGAHPLPEERLTPETLAWWRKLFDTGFLNNYSFSDAKTAWFREMVALARGRGAAVVFMQAPYYRMRDVSPEVQDLFAARIVQFAAEQRVPYINLLTRLNDDVNLWADPLHLNRWGAAEFAPDLVAALAATGTLP
jgi:lysophospholipase L1-like esterase